MMEVKIERSSQSLRPLIFLFLFFSNGILRRNILLGHLGSAPIDGFYPRYRQNTRMRVETMGEYIRWGGFHVPGPDEPASTTHWMSEVHKKWKFTSEQPKLSVARSETRTTDGQPTTPVPREAKQTLTPEEEELFSKPFSLEELVSVWDAEKQQLDQLGAMSAGQGSSAAATASGENASTSDFTAASENSGQSVAAAGSGVDASQPRVTKRERILAQARANARKPLPSKYTHSAPSEDEEKQEVEEKDKEQQDKQKLSLQERLRKLIGGNWD